MIYTELGGALSRRQENIVQENPSGGTVVGITHETLLNIMAQKKPDELLALYCFYAAKVQDQGTQKIWCTTGYVAKGLGWGEQKVKRVKKRLVNLKLIEDIRGKNVNGRFGKPYILVRFINRGYHFQPTGEISPVAKGSTNAPRGKGSAPRTDLKSSKTYTQADARELGFEEDQDQWVVNNYNRCMAYEGSEFLPVTRCTPELLKALIVTQDWDKERLQEMFDSAKERRKHGCRSVTLVRIIWDHYETDEDFTEELSEF